MDVRIRLVEKNGGDHAALTSVIKISQTLFMSNGFRKE